MYMSHSLSVSPLGLMVLENVAQVACLLAFTKDGRWAHVLLLVDLEAQVR